MPSGHEVTLKENRLFTPIFPLQLRVWVGFFFSFCWMDIVTPLCLCLPGRRGWEAQFVPIRGGCRNLSGKEVSQVLEAGEAAVAALMWHRLCQQKKKFSVELHLRQSVRPPVVGTAAELLVSGKRLEVGACLPPRVPCFSFFFFLFPPFMCFGQQVCAV